MSSTARERIRGAARAASAAALAAAIAAVASGPVAPAWADPADPTQTEPADGTLHNVTYIARVDGVAPDTVVTFLLHDNQTTSGDITSLGQTFEANTVLSDPSKAGMQVRLQFPYSANVFCEIDVDGISTVKVQRNVSTWGKSNDPLNGVLQCGAPLNTNA